MIRIRKAAPGDLEIIKEFLLAMLIEMDSLGGHSIAEKEDISAWIDERIRSALQDSNHLLLVADSEGSTPQALGFIEASITQLHPVFKPKQVLHIHSIYVRPNHRRRGIARLLVKAALQWGREQDCVDAALNVLGRNPARHLYESLGFAVFELQMGKSL